MCEAALHLIWVTVTLNATDWADESKQVALKEGLSLPVSFVRSFSR